MNYFHAICSTLYAHQRSNRRTSRTGLGIYHSWIHQFSTHFVRYVDNYRGAGVYPRRPHALLRRQVHVFGAVAHERARAGFPKEPNSAPERQEPLQEPLLVRAVYRIARNSSGEMCPQFHLINHPVHDGRGCYPSATLLVSFSQEGGCSALALALPNWWSYGDDWEQSEA